MEETATRVTGQVAALEKRLFDEEQSLENSKADGIVGNTPVAQARRHEIERMANAALTLAYLRQNDLELILTENHLDSLMTLLDDDSMPLHVLKNARRKLHEISATLVRIDEGLAGQAKILKSRQTTQHRLDSDANTENRRIDNLQALIGFQRGDIDDWTRSDDVAGSATGRNPWPVGVAP
jgi:hypothetical protein